MILFLSLSFGPMRKCFCVCVCVFFKFQAYCLKCQSHKYAIASSEVLSLALLGFFEVTAMLVVLKRESNSRLRKGRPHVYKLYMFNLTQNSTKHINTGSLYQSKTLRHLWKLRTDTAHFQNMVQYGYSSVSVV